MKITKHQKGKPILKGKHFDWSDWLDKRVAKPDGTKYTQQDVESLGSHIGEYDQIYEDMTKAGTWNPGDLDPRAYVMMQSSAFKKNYDSKPWYTGQAEWKTNDQYGNKVTRAPYHDGQMWFSDSKAYGDAYAYAYDHKGIGARYNYDPIVEKAEELEREATELLDKGNTSEGQKKLDESEKYWNMPSQYPEAGITGYNFLSAVPKMGNYRHLNKGGATVNWQHMPFKKQNGTIVFSSPKGKYLTDDVVNDSQSLGDDGVYLYNVDDGPSAYKDYVPDDYKGDLKDRGVYLYNDKSGKYIWNLYEHGPVNEVITQPGFTKKVKFIEGNNGDFDINNPYKYAQNTTKKSSSDNLFAKRGGVLKYGEGKPIKMTTGEQKQLVGWKPNGDSRFIDSSGKETEGTLELPEVIITGEDHPFLRWFRNTTIGASDSPAIMAASGWQQDKNGNWFQQRTEGSDKLADNLAVISTFSPTNPSNVALQGIAKGAKWIYGMANPTFSRWTTDFGDLSKYANKYIGEGAEATVYDNTPRSVAKVVWHGYQRVKNHIPNVEKAEKIGEATVDGYSFPVYKQRKLKVVTEKMWPKVVKKLDKIMQNKGFTIVNDPLVQYRAYRHLGTVIDDIGPGNVGLTWSGKPKIIDFNFQSVPEWYEQGFKLKEGGKLFY